MPRLSDAHFLYSARVVLGFLCAVILCCSCSYANVIKSNDNDAVDVRRTLCEYLLIFGIFPFLLLLSFLVLFPSCLASLHSVVISNTRALHFLAHSMLIIYFEAAAIKEFLIFSLETLHESEKIQHDC